MKRPSKGHVAVSLAASTVAMSFVMAPSSNAATPLPDGSFETPVVAGQFDPSPPSIGPWTVTAGTVDHIGTIWSGANGTQQSVDLNGISAGTLCQSVATTAGAKYELIYWMANNFTNNGTATMNVRADGNVIEAPSHSGSTAGDMNWVRHAAAFTADGDGSTDVCFQSTTTNALAAGPAIDEVSLNLLPTATITKPSGIYFQGEVASTNFACADADGTIASCKDGAGNNSGGAVDTATPGNKNFTVTATDNDGGIGTASGNYTVKPLTTACHSVGVLLPGTRISDANPNKTPCVNATSTQVQNDTIPLLIGSLTYEALAAATGNNNTGMVGAATRAAKVDLNLLGLQVKVEGLTSAVQAQMGAGCSGVDSFGTSQAGKITILGQTYNLGTASRTITLPLGLGAIYINQQVKTATTITQRAVFVDLPGDFLDVAIGQVAVGASCDGPVTVASVIKEKSKPSKAEVEELRTRLEKVESKKA